MWESYKKSFFEDPLVTAIATACIAIGFFDTFGLFGFFNQQLKTPIEPINFRGVFLALAGAVSLSLRKLVQQTRDVTEYRKTQGDHISFRNTGYDLAAVFEDAKVITIIGVSAASLIQEYESELKVRKSKGKQTRVLVVDPNSTALKMSCMRDNDFTSEEADTVENYQRMRISGVISKLKNWDGKSGSLQIRSSHFMPSCEYILAEFGSGVSVLYLRHYLFKTRVGDELEIELTSSGHPSLFTTYENHVSNLWSFSNNA